MIQEKQQNQPNELSFDFEGHNVRVVGNPDTPWWVAADVCEVLELANPRQVVSRLDEDEKGVHSVDTPGGLQDMVIINESGLYSLIFTSRKDAAKRFKKWVTSEVLPAIRKNGRYNIAETNLIEPELVSHLIQENSDLKTTNQVFLRLAEEFLATGRSKRASLTTYHTHATILSKHRNGLCPCCEVTRIAIRDELLEDACIIKAFYPSRNELVNTVPACYSCFRRHLNCELLIDENHRIQAYRELVVQHMGGQLELKFKN